MKIAIYAGMFKENQDGATKTLYELTDTLLKEGIEVGVWAFKITPRKCKGLQLKLIPSIPLPLYPDYRISLPGPGIRAQITAFDPDVIHITVPDVLGLFLMRYARRRGIPVLTSYHTDFPSYLESYRLQFLYNSAWRFFRWFYNKSQSTLAPTNEMIDRLNENGISNVKLWARGIHTDKYNAVFRSQKVRELWGAENKKVILYSGRFVWYKDLETFIQVYDMFGKYNGGEVKFVLAGDGPIKEELERRMPEAFFTGYLTGKKLSRAYASADLLLFPSTTETFGNVVLEALASGIPAVVSNEGGCQEIINQSGGGLVAKGKAPLEFYRACTRILYDPGLYDRCRARGLEYAASRDWETINSNVIEEYRKLSWNRKPAVPATVPILDGGI